MAASTQVVRFTKETTGVTNVTQDVALNFTPKAIIVFSDCATGDNSVAAHYQWSQGFSDGTTHACVTITSDDADAASDTGLVHSSSVYARMSETSNASVLERATCAFITNGVRFTWAVASTTATRIIMWAIGGDDITNVKVGTADVGRTTTGTQDYTGLGFTPVDGESVLFTLSSFNHALSDSPFAGACSHFGCAVSASKEWAIGNVMEDARDPSDTWRVTYNNHCLANLDPTTGAVHYLAEFSTWIADGFRLNYTDAPSASTWDFSYLVIKGGTWDAGVLTTPTAITADVDTAVSVSSRTLRGLMLAGCPTTVSGTIDAYAIISIGATDGTNQACIGNVDEDAQATMDSYRVNNAINIVKVLEVNGANNNTATFDSFTTNNFRLDWTPKDNSAFLFGWVVVADGPAAQQYDRPISETSISVSESLARVQVILKPISETAITVSELLDPTFYLTKNISDTAITTSELLTGTSTQQYDRPISEPTISISEELVRIQTLLKTLTEDAIIVDETLVKGLAFTKPINESAISINDTIVRLSLYLKPISETAITTNDSIARWISVSYTLSEPSISVNDSIAGALFYLRTISENAISVNDTIARILTAIRAISDDPSISTNDTITRIQTLLKTISESAITVNESVVRIPTYLKSINETAINTNDTIVRILAAVRTIADPSLSISDTIARIQTILKTIAEDAISVNDSLQAGLLLTISLVESRIKWYYSVLTRKIAA